MDFKRIHEEFLRYRTPHSAKAVALAVEEANGFLKELPTFIENPAIAQVAEAGKKQRALMETQVELLTKQLEIAKAAQATTQNDAADAKAEASRAYRIAVISAIVGVAGLLLAAWAFIQPRLGL